jgi:hypothetical protein
MSLALIAKPFVPVFGAKDYFTGVYFILSSVNAPHFSVEQEIAPEKASGKIQILLFLQRYIAIY